MVKALAICDVCGFQYKLRELKKNSYGMMVCPKDFEGKYDASNHPQNKRISVLDDESVFDPRPLESLKVSTVPVSAWLPEI
jgi:hypothetical protein|tara:strand:+ start:546 stop:788 length:243 start_codon:yes stop_codon:yes gene_type:complete